ncbi:MAG: hypothetical protein JWN94_1034 [Betaproteobacteria bacterium]|nr:hypothetical protein [Betaproteobacteria bacterium]
MATIRRRRDRWQAQIRVRGYPPQTRSFPCRTDAKAWASAVETEMAQGVFQSRSEAERVTLGDLIARYLAEVTPTKRSAESESRRLAYLDARLGAFTLATIQPKHIAAFRDQRIRAGKAGATVVKDLNSLSHVIDTAIKDWGIYIPSNPVKLVRRPKPARGRDRRLSADEETQLLSACRASRSTALETICKLALETAMRRGELLSLCWSDIDMQRRIARLQQTKNGDARVVPLSSTARAILRSHPRHISNSKVFWQWARADSFENTWIRARSKSGLSDLRFHDLRHEAVTRLFERGLSVPEVATISGHKTWQMLRRYTHLKAENLVDKLG